ncbi:hypothetical protein PGT21_025671 [Puccinia graminis f. sp. tritici]|uniref:Uncharacterized protein n=1 Tax=Puccinia graminis f. sp. tritici TaxID=56615 RepID=A0A5B0N791_PUCGR|nr:hypothetical protein PGT21_025671 [Puccinia graminis f. sp. tritici]
MDPKAISVGACPPRSKTIQFERGARNIFTYILTPVVSLLLVSSFLLQSEVKSKSLIRARDFLNNPSIDLFPLSSITRVSSEVASLTLLPTIISLFIASYPHTLTPTPVQFLLSRPNIHLLNSYLLSGTFINCFFASIPPRLSYCILNYKSITHPFVLNPSSRHSN